MVSLPKPTWLTLPGGRVFSNGVIYAVGGFLPQALGLLLLPIFTRYLSTRDFGVLSYTVMLSSFFTMLGSLSIQTYIIRYYYDCKTAQEARQLFGTVFLFICFYNLALLGLAFLVLPFVFRMGNLQVPFYPYVEITLICTVIEVIGLIPLSYYRAKEQAVSYITLSLAMTFLNGGLSVYLVVGRDLGLLGRYYGQLLADGALLLVYLAILARIAEFRWNSRYIRKALTFCLPIVPAQFLASFASLSDRAILERFVSLGELGLYSVGFGIATVPTVVTTGIYSALQPYVCRLASENKLDAGIQTIKRFYLLLIMGLMFGVIALSEELVVVVTSPAFHESYKITSLLVMSILLQAYLSNVPSLYLMAAGKTKYESPVRFAGALVGFVMLLVLIPRFGIYGAGLSALAAALVTLGGYHLALRRESLVEWGFTRNVALMGAACAVGYGVRQIQTPFPVLTGAIKLCLVASLAAVAIWRESRSLKTPAQDLGLASASE